MRLALCCSSAANRPFSPHFLWTHPLSLVVCHRPLSFEFAASNNPSPFRTLPPCPAPRASRLMLPKAIESLSIPIQSLSELQLTPNTSPASYRLTSSSQSPPAFATPRSHSRSRSRSHSHFHFHFHFPYFSLFIFPYTFAPFARPFTHPTSVGISLYTTHSFSHFPI